MNDTTNIERAACNACGVENPANLHIKTRKREVVFARFFVWKFMRENTPFSLTELSSIFGKDHATVLNGIRSINNVIETNFDNYRKKWLKFLELVSTAGLDIILPVTAKPTGEVTYVNILLNVNKVA